MIADARRSRIADRKKFCDRLRSYGNTLLRSSAILCKELFDTFRTIRDVFERDLLNGQTCLFDNSYRATNSNIVKTLAIHDSFNLRTIDFHSSVLFGSSRARCAEHYICQNVSRVSVEKRLTGDVCTSSDLRIVPIFWDTKDLLCETSFGRQ